MAENRYIDLLKNRGFFCFFCTQFLGAFNDNFYKIIVTLVALDLPATASGANPYIPLIGGLFILPFLLFSGYAGYLADIHSKRTILVGVKIFEIFAMSFGLVAFFLDRMEPMLAVVFLMGLHSTFFSPAKYGILPEMLPDKDLARGNGLLEMSTFLAIILGTSLGGAIYEAWKDRLGWIGVILIAIAALGTLTSLGITKVPPSGASKKFILNPFKEFWKGAKMLYADQPLWLTVMGISYFGFWARSSKWSYLYLGKKSCSSAKRASDCYGLLPPSASAPAALRRDVCPATRSNWGWFLSAPWAWEYSQWDSLPHSLRSIWRHGHWSSWDSPAVSSPSL